MMTATPGLRSMPRLSSCWAACATRRSCGQLGSVLDCVAGPVKVSTRGALPTMRVIDQPFGTAMLRCLILPFPYRVINGVQEKAVGPLRSQEEQKSGCSQRGQEAAECQGSGNRGGRQERVRPHGQPQH